MTLLRPWEAGLILPSSGGRPSDHVHTGAGAGVQGSSGGAGEPCGESKTERVTGSPSATITSRVFISLLCLRAEKEPGQDSVRGPSCWEA